MTASHNILTSCQDVSFCFTVLADTLPQAHRDVATTYTLCSAHHIQHISLSKSGTLYLPAHIPRIAYSCTIARYNHQCQ